MYSVWIFKQFQEYVIIADMVNMQGETLTEMAKILGLEQRTVERRIQRAGIKPITREALYPIGTLEKIRDIKMGRPKKEKSDKK